MYHIDSRSIQPGDTFVCLPNATPYIPIALEAGATDVIHLTHDELGPFAKSVTHDPSAHLTVIGVTGTNGKTTVTHLVHHALTQVGINCAILGTINAQLTTPNILEISQRMAQHLQQGGTHFVMEVSSHAIAQNRIDGLRFFCRTLTNITQDHLDYHGTFEAYRATKLQFMAGDGHHLFPEDFESITLPFSNPLHGRFNHRNMQAAVAILRLCGLTDDQLSRVMTTATPPPGRFQVVPSPAPFTAIVDYAHTPDGMDNVLQEARHMADRYQGRVITVFGCGGNRDRSKRPLMAAVATRWSEVVVVTSDNPRHEDPASIIQDCLTGIGDHSAVHVFLDRREAIQTAMQLAQPNDVVMVLGKGHETTQLIGDIAHHFNDVEEVTHALSDWTST